MKRIIIVAVAVFGLFLFGQPSLALVIIQPTIQATNTTPQTGSNISAIVDQSGLSSAYTSGSTDFASYTASATHATSASNPSANIYFFQPTTGSTIDFALGLSVLVEEVAIWNLPDGGTGTLRSFTLEADDNSSFSSPTLLGSFNLPNEGASPVPAQVRSFAPTQAQFVRITATGNNGASAGTGFGEIAFGVTLVPIPEPSIVTLLGLGLVGIGFLRQRR